MRMSVSTAAFLLLLLTPFVYPGFFPGDVNILTACAAALLLMLALLIEKPRFLILPKYVLAVVLILFAVQLYLYVSGQLLSDSSWLLQAMLYATASALFIVACCIPVNRLTQWLRLYLLAAALWSLVGLFVWLGGTHGEALKIGPVTLALAPALKLAGPFNQGNIFAGLIGFALIFSHWLAWKEKKIRYAIAAAFFTAMLFDTFSRGEWLAYLLTAGLLLFALKPKATELMRCFIIPWLCGLAAGLILAHFSQPSLAASEGVRSIVNSAGASLEARLTIWATALTLFLHAPMIGTGWGQYALQAWLAAPAASDLMTHFGLTHHLVNAYFSAHNLILHLMAEGGLLILAAFLMALWKLIQVTLHLLRKPHNIQLCCALAVISFIIQSQVDISFTKPLPLLLTAFFAGIATAPALRRNCWMLPVSAPIISGGAIIISAYLFWATPIVMQWFSAEKALYAFNINNEASAKRLAAVSNIPRIGALPAIWLGYNVAATGSHTGLLKWIIPSLRAATHDLPLISSYQVLFYALSNTGAFQQACKAGQLIEDQDFTGEENRQAYQDACNGKRPSRYNFSSP